MSFGRRVVCEGCLVHYNEGQGDGKIRYSRSFWHGSPIRDEDHSLTGGQWGAGELDHGVETVPRAEGRVWW